LGARCSQAHSRALLRPLFRFSVLLESLINNHDKTLNALGCKLAGVYEAKTFAWSVDAAYALVIVRGRLLWLRLNLR
jgi:hypothetical protein